MVNATQQTRSNKLNIKIKKGILFPFTFHFFIFTIFHTNIFLLLDFEIMLKEGI